MLIRVRDSVAEVAGISGALPAVADRELEQDWNGFARVVSRLCQFLPQSSRFSPFAAIAEPLGIR